MGSYTFRDPEKAAITARRKAAIASGAMFYVGKPCERHPELKGERRTNSNGCHNCIVERMQEHRKTAKHRRSVAARRRRREEARRQEKRPQL